MCPRCQVRLYPSAPSASLPECPQYVSTRVLQVRLYPSGLYQSAPSVSLPECPRCQVRLYPSTPSVLALCFCGIQNVNTEYFTRRKRARKHSKVLKVCEYVAQVHKITLSLSLSLSLSQHHDNSRTKTPILRNFFKN